jgi:hypothetical protein
MDSSDSPPESKRSGLPERPIQALERIQNERREFRTTAFSRTRSTVTSGNPSVEGKSSSQKSLLDPPTSLRQPTQSEELSSMGLAQRLTLGFRRKRWLIGFSFLMAGIAGLITWHRTVKENTSTGNSPTAAPPHLSESSPMQRPTQKSPTGPPVRRPAAKFPVTAPTEKLAVPAPHGIPKIPIGGGPPERPHSDTSEGVTQNSPEISNREPAHQDRSPDGASSEREETREDLRASEVSPSELRPNEWIDPETGRKKRRVWNGRTDRDAYRTVDVTDDADPLASPEFRPESQ